MNIIEYKTILRSQLDEAKEQLAKKENLLLKIQKDPDNDYVIQSALEEGTKESIGGSKKDISEYEFQLLNTRITHLLLIMGKYPRRGSSNYRKMQQKLEELRKELTNILLSQRNTEQEDRYRCWTLE